MKKIFLYMLIFAFAGCLHAQEKSLFEQATKHYAGQNYQAAIDDYNQILALGKNSAEVYYNLGNAYFKLDSVAPSIYYYYKALQIAPNDKDIKNNLLFAQERAIDVIEPKEKKGLHKFIENLISTFSFNTWAVWGIVTSFLFFIFGLWYYFTKSVWLKRGLFTACIVALMLSILTVIFAYQQYDIQQSRQFAIIFAQKTAIYSEPNHNSSAILKLHAGTKVKVLDHFNNYAKIELPNEIQGWIATSEIKEL